MHFHAGVLAWLVIVVLDVVIACALYAVFRRVSTPVSALAAAFRSAYTALDVPLRVSLFTFLGELLRGLWLLLAGCRLRTVDEPHVAPVRSGR